ncbi:MAG TPA: putative Ig domain-containing protein [Bryobacteraceae bacterium]|nr:putative Ig domain-containing protein [Bryobacteraceae bacterium]
MSASSGDAVTETTVDTAPAEAPVLVVPTAQVAKAGSPVAFAVSASEGSSSPLTLSASALPAGATFNAANGDFEWTPSGQDLGSHTVRFDAANSAGLTTTRTVEINVGSELPEIQKLQNLAGASAVAACVPGSGATLVGSFLSVDAQSRVVINGEDAVILKATPARIEFVCPASAPGTALSISVETSAGSSEPVLTTMQEAAPGILTLPSTRKEVQALAFIEESIQVPTTPGFDLDGQPARPGDNISLLASGVQCDGTSSPQNVAVQFGADYQAPATIVTEYTGICRVHTMVPFGLPGGRVPLMIRINGKTGQAVDSNTVFIDVAY